MFHVKHRTATPPIDVSRRNGRRRAWAGPRDPRHHRRQPEGRRRQDHEHRQHRRGDRPVRATGAGHRPGSAGQRLDGPRRRRTTRARPASTRCSSGELTLADVVQECPDIPGLWTAPATIDLAGAEIELVAQVAREYRLARAIDALLRRTGDFDYVFLDCPPSLGLLTLNALVAAARCCCPIQCEYYALEGLSQLLRTVDMVRTHLNPGLAVGAILLTMYDGRTRLASQVADEVRTHFGAQVLQTVDPALGARVRGAVVRPDRHDLRPDLVRRAGLPRGGRAGDGAGPGPGIHIVIHRHISRIVVQISLVFPGGMAWQQRRSAVWARDWAP